MLNTHSSRVSVIFLAVLSSSLLLNPAMADSSSLQLLNRLENPSTSKMAKNSLLTALQQHFNNEHISVSQAKYQVRPFINKGSIDEGSRSVAQTALAVYDYKDGYDKFDKKISINVFIDTIKQEIADGETPEMSEEEIQTEAEERYKTRQQFINLFNEKSAVKNITTEYLKYYLKMKDEEETEKQNAKTPELSRNFIKNMLKDGGLSDIFKMFHLTPEQVEAMQYYRMQPLTFNMVGQHLPKQRKYQSVLSYDFSSPTSQLSVQIPLAMDFNQGSITLDPSAVMPIIAWDDTELLKQFKQQKTHTMTFSLPKEILQQIPTDVIYDALIHSIEVGFSEMNEEYFTPVNISNDKFAKKVHAKQAVKVHWGSKQMGEFMGKAIKSIGKDLQAHIDKNPSQYQDKKTLKKIIEGWTSTSQDFQSKDVGGLMQLIEAIAPLNLNQTAYYYLNNHKLVAYQAKFSIGSELYGWTNDMVVQTRYDEKSVKNSPLYAVFNEDFGKNAPQSINGNDWIAREKTATSYKKQAEQARDDYDDVETDDTLKLSDFTDKDWDNISNIAKSLTDEDYKKAGKTKTLYDFTNNPEDMISPVAKEDNDLFFKGNFSNDANSDEYQKTKEAFLQFQSTK
ncbi:MAG: hypothetical protein KGV51_04310 [Moraxellaceae bacterium]|nr:hypothetical protein [Moraxellaceae bacterium]